MARTEIGELQVQGMDYAYTVHGWIKGVNSDVLSSAHDIGKDGSATEGTNYNTLHKAFAQDAFGYSLSYFSDGPTLDYRSINPTFNTVGGSFVADNSALNLSVIAPALYNGNISRMTTSYINIDPAAINPVTGPIPLSASTPQLNAYKYDQLNRIKHTQAYKDINLSTNAWKASTDSTYEERFSYDANGNITMLKRNGNKTGTAVGMDNLTYYYLTGTNQLDYVTDIGTNPSDYANDLETQAPGNYKYDKIGNLIADASEKILSIEWTVYGKLKKITKSDTLSDLVFAYDANGNRIAKIIKPKTASGTYKPDSLWITTHYVRDAQGNVMATYKKAYSTSNQRTEIALKEQHIYGSSRLGLLNSSLRVDVKEGVVLENHFDTGPDGWAVGGSVVYDSINERLTCQTTVQYSGMGRQLKVTPGKVYAVRYQCDLHGNYNDYVYMEAYDNISAGVKNHLGAKGSANGANTFTFTTPTGTDIQIFVMKGSASGSTTIFSIDDVVISEYVPGPAEISSRNTFDTGTENWIGGSYDAVGKRLYVSTSTQYSGVSLPISTVTDGDYVIAFDVDLSLNPSDYVYAEIFDQTTTPWAHLATVVLVQGNNAFRLTAPTPSLFMNVLKGSASGTLTQFYIDNVVITGPPIIPQIVSSRALGSRSYELGNHLGNVVSVITDKKTPLGSTTVTGYLADVISTTDYYAFGSPQPGRNFNSPNYRYGFNGKENDPETVSTGEGTQDYGLRTYNPDLGRFLSVDFVSSKFPWLSVYQFASNRPILAIDLDGLEAYDAPNNASLFSMLNWRSFIRTYSKELVTQQKNAQKSNRNIDDKDCADLAVEMMAYYHRNMGVPLSVTIKYDNGSTVIIDSNDPKYKDNVQKDAAGKYYAAFEWFLDDLKKNIGPNGIAQISSKLNNNEASTGDLVLYSNGTEYFHTQVINDDFKTGDYPTGYIQASGHYYGRGNSKNRINNPNVTTGGLILTSFTDAYRFNFLKGIPTMTEEEKSTFLEPKKVVNLTQNEKEPELIIR